MKKITLTVNGKKVSVQVHPFARLLDVIREGLELTGTKEGCGEGECGACSVLLDGELVNSCLVPVLQANGKAILTVEGLSKKSLCPLQKSFMKCGGAQCGICTPGMLIASQALKKKKKRLSPKDIREGLAGNLCRCTGYSQIIESIQKSGDRT
ncbi:MAG: (2Fe-2S)-binding protein [Deltaproteobacteria bacterium]|nr:(2Fe-2S)-binding protein [Deltaproteobacteria bacterium]